MNGEIAFVRDVDANANYFKVGDGSSKFCNVPYVTYPSQSSPVVIGTKAEWQSQPSFLPHRGQIVVWTDRSTLSSGTDVTVVPAIKVGDGNAYNVDLPFAGDDVMAAALSALAEHAASNSHLSPGEREFWNHKISVGKAEDPEDDGVQGETLIITRN